MRPFTMLGLGMALVVLAGAIWIASLLWAMWVGAVEVLHGLIAVIGGVA